MTEDPDHQVQQPRRRQRPWRLLQAFSSPDSYGLVLLLIVVTYILSAATTTAWALSLVLFVQITTIWATLQASQARRLREITGAILVISAAVAILNLFLPRTPAAGGGMAVVSGLLYVAAPAIIVRHLVLRYTVDTQTVLGAIAAYLMVGMAVRLRLPRAGGGAGRPLLRVAGGGQLLPGPILLVHHLDHDRVRQPGPGRQPRPEPRRRGDAYRAAVLGDGGGQGGQHLATRPRSRAPAHRERPRLSQPSTVKHARFPTDGASVGQARAIRRGGPAAARAGWPGCATMRRACGRSPSRVP
jgi:hypothetical protein